MDSDEAPDSPVAAVKRGRGRPKGQTKSGKPSAPKVPSGKGRGRPKGIIPRSRIETALDG